MRAALLALWLIGITALSTFLATTLYDNHERNRYFEVICERPNGVSTTYGPYWKIRDDRLGLKAQRFCADITPMIDWNKTAPTQ